MSETNTCVLHVMSYVTFRPFSKSSLSHVTYRCTLALRVPDRSQGAVLSAKAQALFMELVVADTVQNLCRLYVYRIFFLFTF